jgi:hypothetical protein
MSLFLAEGLEWLKNKTKKIEGYRGIMGPIPEIDSINASDPDFTNVASQSNNLSQGITDYTTKYNELKTITNNYLGMTAQNGSNRLTNYNMFVNNPMDMGQIIATPFAGGACIKNGTSNSALAGLTDASTQGFDTLYANNFPNTPAGAQSAINACKFWAADSQTTAVNKPASTYFAVTKDITTNKFKCFSGNTLTTTPTQYTVKQTAYNIISTADATRGGLFKDGTIGVFNEILSGSSTDPSNPNNTQFIATASGYSACNKQTGGELNKSTVIATLGSNCTNVTYTPVNIRYVYIKASQDTTNTDGYIHISQLAVYGFRSGIAKNLSNRADPTNIPKPVAHSGVGTLALPFSNKTNTSWGTAVPNNAIDGTNTPRVYPGMYHSLTKDRNEWWSVDLGQEYPVYQIDYYNEINFSWRAIGMQMHFKDNSGNVVRVKDSITGALVPFLTISDSAKQSFIISQ